MFLTVHMCTQYRYILHNLFCCTFQTLNFLQLEGFLATLKWAGLIAPFFQEHMLTSCLCITFCTYSISDFSIVILLRLLMISDSGWYYCNCFEASQTIHIRWQHWLQCKRSDCFSDQPFLSLFLDLPLPWDTTMLILGQLITLKLHLNVQIKRRVTCLSLWIET